MNEPKTLEIMGHVVDLDRIINPALRKVIRERLRYDEFMFSGHDRYKEETWSGDHREHKEHQKHSERYDKWKKWICAYEKEYDVKW